MADPHVIEDLDGFDRMTVSLYRLGLVLAGAALLAVAAVGVLHVIGVLDADRWSTPLLLGPSAAAALSAACVHLYDKRIRWLIASCTPLGLALQAGGLALAPVSPGLGWTVQVAGAGFCMVSLSALAFKEWFCFRIPGLRLVPVFLGVGTVPLWLGVWPAVAALWGIGGVLVGLLALAKLRMPLTHDIGDRSKYQV